LQLSLEGIYIPGLQESHGKTPGEGLGKKKKKSFLPGRKTFENPLKKKMPRKKKDVVNPKRGSNAPFPRKKSIK